MWGWGTLCDKDCWTRNEVATWTPRDLPAFLFLFQREGNVMYGHMKTDGAAVLNPFPTPSSSRLRLQLQCCECLPSLGIPHVRCGSWWTSVSRATVPCSSSKALSCLCRSGGRGKQCSCLAHSKPEAAFAGFSMIFALLCAVTFSFFFFLNKKSIPN